MSPRWQRASPRSSGGLFRSTNELAGHFGVCFATMQQVVPKLLEGNNFIPRRDFSISRSELRFVAGQAQSSKALRASKTLKALKSLYPASSAAKGGSFCCRWASSEATTRARSGVTTTRVSSPQFHLECGQFECDTFYVSLRAALFCLDFSWQAEVSLAILSGQSIALTKRIDGRPFDCVTRIRS